MCLKLLWDASAFLIFHSEKLNKIRSDLFSGPEIHFFSNFSRNKLRRNKQIGAFFMAFLVPNFSVYVSPLPRCLSKEKQTINFPRKVFAKEGKLADEREFRCCLFPPHLFSWQLWMGKFLRHEGVDCLEVSDFSSKHKSFFASSLYTFFQLSSRPP